MALAIGSMVVNSGVGGAPNAAQIGWYGQIVDGSAGDWSVLWTTGPRNGVFRDSLADASLTELTLPFVVDNLLNRRVIPDRACDPSMAGVVLMESAAGIVVVMTDSGVIWFGLAANVRVI